jgi:predicted RNase H-like nuclease (RuvC/YqgF family)
MKPQYSQLTVDQLKRMRQRMREAGLELTAVVQDLNRDVENLNQRLGKEQERNNRLEGRLGDLEKRQNERFNSWCKTEASMVRFANETTKAVKDQQDNLKVVNATIILLKAVQSQIMRDQCVERGETPPDMMESDELRKHLDRTWEKMPPEARKLIEEAGMKGMYKLPETPEEIQDGIDTLLEMEREEKNGNKENEGE